MPISPSKLLAAFSGTLVQRAKKPFSYLFYVLEVVSQFLHQIFAVTPLRFDFDV